jgi:hypothetical protein
MNKFNLSTALGRWGERPSTFMLQRGGVDV